MRRRQLDYDGLRGMLRLFLLALILALVLWWAVAISGGPRRSIAKLEPRKPEKRPTRNGQPLHLGSAGTSVGELVLIDQEETQSSVTDCLDDYWPDIIDA